MRTRLAQVTALVLLVLCSAGCYGFDRSLSSALGELFFLVGIGITLCFTLGGTLRAISLWDHAPSRAKLIFDWLVGLTVVLLTALVTEGFSPWPGTVRNQDMYFWFLPLPAALVPLASTVRYKEQQQGGAKRLWLRLGSALVGLCYLGLLGHAVVVRAPLPIELPIVEMASDTRSYGRTSDGRVFTVPYGREIPGRYVALAGSLGLTADGQVFDLLNGHRAPLQLEVGVVVRQIAASARIQCLLDDKKRVWCLNASMPIGMAKDDGLSQKPVLVPRFENVRRVAVAAGNACALDEAGGVGCTWPGTERRPLQRLLEAGAKEIAMTEGSHCVIDDQDSVLCGGANEHGEVNSASELEGADLVAMKGLEHTSQLCAGAHHLCARGGDGGVRCWGGNGWGQLGLPPGAPKESGPLLLGLPGKAEAVFCSQTGSCARMADGRIYCWGAYPSPAAMIDGKSCAQPFFGPPVYCTELPELAQLPKTYIPYREAPW